MAETALNSDVVNVHVSTLNTVVFTKVLLVYIRK